MRHTSNCAVFAYRMYRRRRGKALRGYVGWRWSDFGKFPHFHYSELRPYGRFRMVSYKPIHPSERKMPPPCFAGHVCWGDPPPKPRPPKAGLFTLLWAAVKGCA